METKRIPKAPIGTLRIFRSHQGNIGPGLVNGKQPGPVTQQKPGKADNANTLNAAGSHTAKSTTNKHVVKILPAKEEIFEQEPVARDCNW